jgi:UDP-N-acetylglucosamine 1-carboxyvinyltransferase
MGKILIDLGVELDYDPAVKVMHLNAKNITSNKLSPEAAKFRGSYYLWGALLSRFGITGEFNSLMVHSPGGDGFSGIRKNDYHINLLENMFGAKISKTKDNIKFSLPAKANKIASTIYSTDKPSHGATFHWMLGSALNQNKYIYNASLEYEVPHLLGILNAMGANLRGTNSTAIGSFERKNGGLLKGGDFKIMPDRIEAGSYAIMALAARQKIIIKDMDINSCRPWLNSIIGIAGRNRVKKTENEISFDFTNLEFPGQRFIMSPVPGKETDLQQIWTAALGTAASQSEILDPIWIGRHEHIPEFKQFGLNADFDHIRIQSQITPEALRIRINPSAIHSADASGTDLRGTFGAIVLATMANGTSIINEPRYALRGYPNLIYNLQKLGIVVQLSSSGTMLSPLPQKFALTR